MKINRFILSGIVLILFGGLLFITDALTPFVRPVTDIFLMGSSKGKDILFFALFGFFLIASQLYKAKPIKTRPNRFLLIAIISAVLIFTIAIALEIYLRSMLGIDLNTIFVTVNPSFSTTSILHSHLTKSILGQFIAVSIGSLVGSDINTASSLYHYISPFAVPIVILIAVLFVSSVLALQKRHPLINVILSFFLAIMFIGCFDGGIMGIPGAFGLFGCILVYYDEYYILRTAGEIAREKSLIKACKKYMPDYAKTPTSKAKFLLKRGVPYFIGLFIITLRISICLVGANAEYYEVDIYNPEEGLNLTGDYPISHISEEDGKIAYRMDSSLNEMNLTNELSESLKNRCDYYTVSWNFYSYL